MIATFEYEIARGDDVFYLKVAYSGHSTGSRWDADYYADLISVTLHGEDFDTTAQEDASILAAAYEHIATDIEDDEGARGDYLNDMRGGW